MQNIALRLCGAWKSDSQSLSLNGKSLANIGCLMKNKCININNGGKEVNKNDQIDTGSATLIVGNKEKLLSLLAVHQSSSSSSALRVSNNGGREDAKQIQTKNIYP